MDLQIDAIYDGGVFKPLSPLSLPDQARVVLKIGAPSTPNPVVTHDEWQRRLLSIAKDCGVSLPDSAVSSEGLYE